MPKIYKTPNLSTCIELHLDNFIEGTSSPTCLNLIEFDVPFMVPHSQGLSLWGQGHTLHLTILLLTQAVEGLTQVSRPDLSKHNDVRHQ